MNQFKAVGNLIGSYFEDEEERGFLRLIDGIEIEAYFGHRLRKKILTNPEAKSEMTEVVRAWRLYPTTDFEGKLSKVQLNGCHTKDSQYWSDENYIIVRGKIISSNQNNRQKIVVEIRPGRRKGSHYRAAPFQIIIKGNGSNLPLVNKDEFWSFKVIVVDGCCQYLSGRLLDGSTQKRTRSKLGKIQLKDRPLQNSYDGKKAIASTQLKKNHLICQENQESCIQTKQNTLAKQKTTRNKNDNGFEIETVMIDGRTPELTIKFNTRLDCPETGKKVNLEILGENGILVRATVNRKILKKQVEKMDSCNELVGALRGKMSAIAADGVIELESASLTVYEQKSQLRAENQTQSSANQAIAS